MKKTIFIVLVVVWASVIFAQTESFIRVKQVLGTDQRLASFSLGSKKVGMQIVYDSRQLLTLGVGPSASFSLKKVKITAFAYADAIIDLKDADFPISSYMGEGYIVVAVDKWSIFSRTAVLTDKEWKAHLSGKEYLGYQIGSCSMRLLSEWRKTDEKIVVVLGPSIEYTKGKCALGMYLGGDTKAPHTKTGWLEIKIKL